MDDDKKRKRIEEVDDLISKNPSLFQSPNTKKAVKKVILKHLDKVTFKEVEERHLVEFGVKMNQIVEWKEDVTHKGSEWFEETLKKLKEYWTLNCESSRRTLIDIFILEAISAHGTNHADNKKKVWGEVTMEYAPSSTERGIGGRIDYVISPSTTLKNPGKPYCIVVEAKKEWPQDAPNQLIAEMFCCIKNNADNKDVYGILSNGELWCFYKMDKDLNVFVTDLLLSKAQVLGYIVYCLQH